MRILFPIPLPLRERIEPACAACPFWALTARVAWATARAWHEPGVRGSA